MTAGFEILTKQLPNFIDVHRERWTTRTIVERKKERRMFPMGEAYWRQRERIPGAGKVDCAECNVFNDEIELTMLIRGKT